MKRRNKFLSVILSVCLLAGLLPITAFEAEGASNTYDLWIGGVQVTDDNAYDITAAINTITPGAATGSARFDPATNTLTLNDFVYEGEGYGFIHQGLSSAASIYSGMGVLHVTATGTNTLHHKADNCSSYGIYAIGDFIVTEQSTGSITAVGGTVNITNGRSLGVFVREGNLIVSGGTLTGRGNDAGIGPGLLSTGVWCLSSDITVNHGAQLIGYGGSGNISRGICTGGKLTVDDGTITGNGGAGGTISHGISTSTLESNSEKASITGTAGSATERMSSSESIGIVIWYDSVFSKGHIVGTGGQCPNGKSQGLIFHSGFTMSGGVMAAQGENGAFNTAPMIDDGFFQAGIWYGENETEANASGAKRKTVLADNYGQRYVRIATSDLPPFDVSVSPETLHLTEGKIHKNRDAKLTASYSDVPDNPSVSYTYQWYACDEKSGNRIAVDDSDNTDNIYRISEELRPGTYYYVCEVSGYDYNSDFVASVSTEVVKVEVDPGIPVVIFDPDFGSFAEIGRVTIEMPISDGKLEGDVPRPAAEGYMFVGWYNGDNMLIEDPGNYRFTHTTRLYARYTITHTAVFDANGGVFSDGTRRHSVTFIEDVLDKRKVPSDPTREGYHFRGWYYKGVDGKEYKLKLPPGEDYYPLAGDFKFYAKWSKDASAPADQLTPSEAPAATDTSKPAPALKSKDNPDTGDTRPLGLWLAVTMIALAGLVGCTAAWRRKAKQENESL